MLMTFDRSGGAAGDAAGWRGLYCWLPRRYGSRRARANRSSGERPLLAGWGVGFAGCAARLRARLVCMCVCALRLAQSGARKLTRVRPSRIPASIPPLAYCHLSRGLRGTVCGV